MQNNWPTFRESMQYSKGFIFNKAEHDKWQIVEERYEYIKKKLPSEQKIPKILHQIWIGSNMPQHILNRCNTLQEQLPKSWTYKLWTENDLPELPNFTFLKEYKKTPCVGQKSDLLRLYLLYEFGGVYCDTDYVLYGGFEELLGLDFFGGIVYNTVPNIANSILGSTPKNNLITDLQMLDQVMSYSDHMSVLNTTGQGLITRKFFKHVLHMKNIMVLPNSFLYPYPNCVTDRTLGEDYSKYIKPETKACHLWNCSWM